MNTFVCVCVCEEHDSDVTKTVRARIHKPTLVRVMTQAYPI